MTVEVDSLSVPPADFDWQSAGLHNPLKGQSPHSITSHMCDEFFQSQQQGHGGGSGLDAQAILEKDLQAMGLSSSHAPSSSQHHSKPQSNGHILSGREIATHQASK